MVLVERFEEWLGYGWGNVGLGRGREVVDKDESGLVGVFDDYVDIGEVGGVGGEVMLDRVVVGDVNEYIGEYGGMGRLVGGMWVM